MFPLRDNIPPSRRPVVNYAIIAACSLVFLRQVGDERGGPSRMAERYGMTPARLLHPERRIVVPERQVVRTPLGLFTRDVRREAARPPFNPWWTLLTCMFLHGGWAHFLGNMWFLHIFGDNVEDRLGRLGYAVFYLASGVLAGAAHMLTNSTSTVPTIGASGAIAGVMGAYMLLYPRARIVTVVPVIVFLEIFLLPAQLFLGLWFVLQVWQSRVAAVAGQAGGVAWWAHIGGFAAGFAITYLLREAALLRPPRPRLIPVTHHRTHYRRGWW